MPTPDTSILMNRLLLKAKVRHMLVLIRLIEFGSMRRTAKALDMAQPAVTQIVAELEALLETDLFFRHARGVEPTDAAKELLPVAHRILAALRDGAEGVANRLQQQGGVVRVSASPAAVGGMLHGRLDTFARRYPDIQVVIFETSSGEPLIGVSDGSADIICTREPKVVPEGWTFCQCVDDELIAVCGPGHPFAKLPNPTLQQLGSGKWLMNQIGSVARNRFEEIFVRSQWPKSARCQIVMHIPRLTREMLETGRYLAILPRSVAASWIEDGSVCEIRSDITAPLTPLGFLWRGDQAGAATSAFARFLSGS